MFVVTWASQFSHECWCLHGDGDVIISRPVHTDLCDEGGSIFSILEHPTGSKTENLECPGCYLYIHRLSYVWSSRIQKYLHWKHHAGLLKLNLWIRVLFRKALDSSATIFFGNLHLPLFPLMGGIWGFHEIKKLYLPPFLKLLYFSWVLKRQLWVHFLWVSLLVKLFLWCYRSDLWW